MADETTNEAREHASHSSEAPTLSSYREYAAAMSGNDQAAKRRLADQPKPVHVEYEKLYRTEQTLRDHSRGDNYLSRMRSFVADARDKQLPRLNDARDRRAAVWHIKSEYEQWGHERKELHARQRAAFERNVELAMQKRQELADTQESPDTAAFFTRREVIGRYVQQHENLNRRLEQEITGYIDRVVERQTERNRQSMSQSESAILDEIVRRPREPAQARDRDSGRER